MAYNKENDRLIFKFNGGNGAVLCSNCYKIICEGTQISNNYLNSIKNGQHGQQTEPVFCCDKCEHEWNETKNKNVYGS